MKKIGPTESIAELKNKHYSILISAPENFAHSNGINVLLNAARSMQAMGLKVDIVPANSDSTSFTRLPFPYSDLPISWRVHPGCSAILSDTVSPARLQEVRAKAAQICHYTMAPNGLFGSEGMWSNRNLVQPGEKQAVYSPQISTQLPSFYLQTHFPHLDPWIEIARKQPGPRASSQLRASVYPGKGHLAPVPQQLRRRIQRSRSHLITRFRPASKAELYKELASSDLLICYDPITSLAYEASLLGIPVFIPQSWDEADFKPGFPVRLDGIVWNDLPSFLNILEHGFNHQSVIDSYRTALENNEQVLLRLLHFAFTDASPATAEQINSYWEARQPFFTSLRLPSPNSQWKIQQSLRATTPLEWLYDQTQNAIDLISRISERILSRIRRLLAHGLHN